MIHIHTHAIDQGHIVLCLKVIVEADSLDIPDGPFPATAVHEVPRACVFLVYHCSFMLLVYGYFRVNHSSK